MKLMPRAKHRMQAAEAFDHVFLRLRHDLDPLEDHDDQQERAQQVEQVAGQQIQDEVFGHISSLLVQ